MKKQMFIVALLAAVLSNVGMAVSRHITGEANAGPAATKVELVNESFVRLKQISQDLGVVEDKLDQTNANTALVVDRLNHTNADLDKAVTALSK